ncbi:bifunctional diguanylate cyclase/phosphodiesterase [Catenovulum sediminis]|uniref:bifunctional diguanylate cyclase/phosphodiesterase n=1 Tax=Catenovulum sediminis TaxID=1740262 RepID=UPI00117CCE13|nr:bifunctional diguanylate cyclase/phosphodiesterase [Catenovulum sediminis]
MDTYTILLVSASSILTLLLVTLQHTLKQNQSTGYFLGATLVSATTFLFSYAYNLPSLTFISFSTFIMSWLISHSKLAEKPLIYASIAIILAGVVGAICSFWGTYLPQPIYLFAGALLIISLPLFVSRFNLYNRSTTAFKYSQGGQLFLIVIALYWLSIAATQAQPANNFIIVLTVLSLFSAVFAFLHHDVNTSTHRVSLQTDARLDPTLQHWALHDTLTGLPNSISLEHNFRRIVQQNPNSDLAVAIIKLDDFETLNQTLGYSTGDMVLIQISKRINQTLAKQNSVYTIETQDKTPEYKPESTQQNAPTDKKLAALSGLRFAFIADLTQQKHIFDLLVNEIRQAIPAPIPYESMMLNISFRLGIAPCIHHSYDIQKLLQQAQHALDSNQTQHLGYSTYSPDMEVFNQSHQSLLSDLNLAVNNNQLELFIQPIIDLKSRSIVAGESLIRWRHPKQGLIPPEQFIQLAEHTGVIYSITRWVLTESVQALVKLKSEGVDCAISVNLSSKDLLQHEFIDFIQNLLEANQLDATQLILEIREQALIQAPQQSHDIIERLDSIGIKTVIDDFGTGFSSLAYLRKLPISGLKIDRQFIANLTQGSRHKTLVNTIIDVGRNLQLKIYAEGIEDREIEQKMKEMGCDLAQGFLYSRPIEFAGFTHWAKQWRQKNNQYEAR